MFSGDCKAIDVCIRFPRDPSKIMNAYLQCGFTGLLGNF